jgi:hypothetical protein
MKCLACLVAVGVLAGCGGSSDSAVYQQAVDLANAKEGEARSLAADSPCDQLSQCGTIVFLAPTGACPALSYKPYSLVSATAAAASAAAAQQQALAIAARTLAPPPAIACTAVINPPPPLACTAAKCQAV